MILGGLEPGTSRYTIRRLHHRLSSELPKMTFLWYIYITGPSHFKVKYLQIYKVNFDDSYIDMYTIT